MRKIFSFLLLLTILFVGGVVSASATSVSEMCYVEYQTEASINFEEVIEVVLTNLDTGHHYSQRLHRVNDYTANASVPAGIYAVNARIINQTGTLASEYSLVCLTEEIEVVGGSTATVVSLRVDQFVGGDVSGSASDFDNWTDEDWENYLDPSTPDESEPDDSTLGATEQDTSIGGQNAEPAPKQEGRSMLVSAIVTAGVLAAIALSLYFFKNKQES